MAVKTIHWENKCLYIIDQTLLPVQEKQIELCSLEDVWEAIKTLRVRGAPAIGICAAYGVLVGTLPYRDSSLKILREHAENGIAYLATSRPTAVNLFHSLGRMHAALNAFSPSGTAAECFNALESEANLQFSEDAAMCLSIGKWGSELLHEGMGILTHCNAGGLATSGYGTALAPLYTAHEKGMRFKVYADETRPLLQGARLTAWELCNAGIDVTLICDNMAAVLMRDKKVHAVIVGADRIAANGDTANKIGTYGVAVMAHFHNIPFYVAAPASTFDFNTKYGLDIPIEERSGEEVRTFGSLQTAPEMVPVYNPSFDVTPAALIAAFITDKGLLYPPYASSLKHLC